MTAEPRTSGASEWIHPSCSRRRRTDLRTRSIPAIGANHRDEVGMKGYHQRVQARVSRYRCAIGLGPEEGGKRPED